MLTNPCVCQEQDNSLFYWRHDKGRFLTDKANQDWLYLCLLVFLDLGHPQQHDSRDSLSTADSLLSDQGGVGYRSSFWRGKEKTVVFFNKSQMLINPSNKGKAETAYRQGCPSCRGQHFQVSYTWNYTECSPGRILYPSMFMKSSAIWLWQREATGRTTLSVRSFHPPLCSDFISVPLHETGMHYINHTFYRPQSREIMHLVASVRPSVCLLSCLSALSQLNHLTFDLDIWYGGQPLTLAGVGLGL